MTSGPAEAGVPRTADVIVLGAGPAGSAAAITAATAGLRVLLIEREAFPRPAPGESLHPGVQSLLRTLGVEDAFLAQGFPRYPGHLVRWGGPERFEPFGQDAGGPWLGFHAWRPTFDRILLDRAQSLGVEVRQPCQVRGPVAAGDVAAGLDTDAGPIRAGVVVDATGRWRAVSRWLGLRWTNRGPPRRAWYGYATGAGATGREEIPALTADGDGWTWVARVRERTYSWVRVNFDQSRPPDGWLPPELAGLDPHGLPAGADVTGRIADEPAGPGYFLVGDAAAVLDPASSHGVLKALMSGMLAGYLIGQVCRRRADPAAAAARYCRWVRDWFDRDTAGLDTLYASLATGDAG
jgi:flavin-dependent dehydrogenase